MLEFVFLTEKFYSDYEKCSEIERKQTRPYICIEIEVNGVLFGIPLRSNINHTHVYWTDKANRCGIDFSKSVVIIRPQEYIEKDVKPYIRPAEFDKLRGKEHFIKLKMQKYISDYKKAKNNPRANHNANLLRYSTLQYFEEYI